MNSDPDSPDTDSEAVAASLVDPERFRVVFVRYFDDVFRFLVFRSSGDVAADLASETFAVAFRKRGTFDLTSLSARPWLLAIAANLARDASRRRSRQRRAYLRLRPSPSTRDETDDAVDRVYASVQSMRLQKSLVSLTAEQRDVVLLIAGFEHSYEEVATALEIPIGTVRSRFSRARAQLRSDLVGITTSWSQQEDPA